MKTSATFLLIVLTLVACESMEPAAVQQPPQDEELTIESLTQIAEKISSSERPTGLLVVGQAALLYNAIQRDPASLQWITNHRGFQRANWMEDDNAYSWSHDCWLGSPSFPGSDAWASCGPLTGPFGELPAGEVLHFTREIIRGVAGMDDYQMVWSEMDRDGDFEDYQVWYTNADGQMYYWRWTTGMPVEAD